MIRQEHQPFAVKIHSTDGKHPHRYPTEVVLHRRSATWIIQRRHDILRLIQHEIDIRLDRTQMLAVYLNMDAIGIDLRTKLRHDLAVTRPAAINSSDFRRDASPVPAMTFCNLTSIFYRP